MRRAVHRNHAPILHAHAAAMRTAPTTTEALLWEHLRGSQLGVGFRRQVPIGQDIRSLRHGSLRWRDRALGRLGWRVVRMEAALLVRDFGEAAEVVRAALRHVG